MPLTIRTPYGNQYRIYENGNIERMDMPGMISGQWKMLGISHVKRSHFIPLSELLNGKIPLEQVYKNGNPQWTVRDLDHGTTREWGNTKVHGIARIEIERAEKGGK